MRKSFIQDVALITILPAPVVLYESGKSAEINSCIFYRDTTYSVNPHLNYKGGALAIFGPADVTLRNCLVFFCRSFDGIYVGCFNKADKLKLRRIPQCMVVKFILP